MDIDTKRLNKVLKNRTKFINPREFEKSPLIDTIQRAGVLIVLLPTLEDKYGYSILFNQRSDHVPNHKGQIAFPGGGYKDEDLTLLNTAIRETFEESGLKIRIQDILGEMDDFLTISDFLVTPFIGLGPSKPRTLRPDGWEIIESFEVPLSVLMDEKNSEIKQKEYLGKVYDVHYYYYNDRIIWGVTGEILYHFLKILKEEVYQH
ncbi:MAG: putative Nudix hydrolase NudL [Candidatus Heimdallarchaeota archaeon LC_3]|nr:MAG: putative Nudix hydrolase NudL [Candidatus Heimdallarchaeota archaeon LC_3]